MKLLNWSSCSWQKSATPKVLRHAKSRGQRHGKPLRFELMERRELLSADWQFQLANNDDGNPVESSFSVESSCLDSSKHLYLAGNVNTWLDADPTEVGISLIDTEGTGVKGFVASYTAEGTLEWAEQIGTGTGACRVASVTVGNDGSAYMTGTFGGTVSFGIDAFGNPCEFTVERTSGFSLKYGSDHVLDWAVPFVSDWVLSPAGIAVDESGDVYVTGGLEGTNNQLGDFSISETGASSAFVAKLGGAGGEVLWVRHDLGGGNSEGTQIAVDNSGNVAVAGTFRRGFGEGFDLGGQYLIQKGYGDVFVAQLDSQTGEVGWMRRVGSNYSVASNYVGEVVNGLVFDGEGSLCLTGTFEQTADFGSYVLSSAGERDAYIAKFDNNGTVLWADSLAASAPAYGNGITTDAGGNVFVAGYFRGVADLDPGARTNCVDAGDTTDGYFLKLDGDGSFEQLWHVPGIDSTSDTAIAGGDFVFAGTDGSLYFIGRFRGTINLPTGTLVNDSLTQLRYYVCKFTPQLEENQVPVAMGETYEIYQGQPLRVDRFDGVLVNDCDANLDSLAAVVEVGPEHGTLVLDADGGFVYVPDEGAPPLDQFTYRVSDGKGGEALATATINIVPLSSTLRYDSVNVPVGIADLRTIRSELVISDPFHIADLNVELSISHNRDADLDVYLISPQGTRVELFTDVGGLGKGFTSTILDDEAADSITSGLAPFTGTYRPEGALSAFDGQSLAGTWYLEITDDQNKQTGSLTSWSLIASPGSAAPQIVVSRTEGLQTTEQGAIDAFEVYLDTPPTADVTMGLLSSDTGEGQVFPASLTFTPENWSQPQTVYLTGVDDSTLDDEVAYTIITRPAVSTDPRFDGLDARDVSAINVDDDLPPVTVAISDVSVREGKPGVSTIFSFTVSRTGDAGRQDIGMDYATVAGSATEGIDYAGRKGSIHIQFSASSATIQVEVFGDGIGEADETFTVALFNASANVTFTKAIGVGTIINDDKLVASSSAYALLADTAESASTATLPASPAVELSSGKWDLREQEPSDLPVWANSNRANEVAKGNEATRRTWALFAAEEWRPGDLTLSALAEDLLDDLSQDVVSQSLNPPLASLLSV